jgi:hypothetical protein
MGRTNQPDGGEKTEDRIAESVEIPPSPEILRVLARIEFPPWQCVAELVDNSFDEFLSIRRSDPKWTEPLRVDVSIPSAEAAGKLGAMIMVRDNGRGLTLERVRRAVSAGFSGNDPFSKLGLFGMGFNVATARLGTVTRFLTTRAGEAEWVGVEIDINNIGEGFRVPVVRQPKDSPEEHGTRVEIEHLEPLAQSLMRPQAQGNLRKTLGGTYSYLLDQEHFQLFVNDIAVEPHRHCTWSKSRFVTRGKEVIPAVIEIEEPLDDRPACKNCGAWQELSVEACERCGSPDLEMRERRVWGWVGIQRYLDQKEFGLDFLRNGRKIMRFDKSVFQWRDPDDPGAQGDIEYPIEVPYQQGRIVGEIHLDHVPVTYTKDSFDTSDRGWHSAVRIIRGDGPLLPTKAKNLGYPENGSPLARLHRGYRRNDPGASYLTPGNGKTRFDNPDWVKAFKRGVKGYDSDKKWWDAVQEHDRLAAEAKRLKEESAEAGREISGDPTKEFLTAPELRGAEETPEASSEPVSESALAARLKRAGTRMAELNGDFSAAGVPGRAVHLEVFEVRGQRVMTPEGKVAPVWFTGVKGGFNAFVDLDHPHFSTFADEPTDLVLMELAQHMIVRAQGVIPPTISSVFHELKDRYLSSHAIDPNRLIPEASQLMRDIQERMIPCIVENPRRPWENALVEYERHMTSNRIVEALRISDADSAVYSGEYLTFVPPSVVSRIVEEWPEAFFDGRLFSFPYADVKEEGARRQVVASITSYLNDVAWLTSVPPTQSRAQLVRARLSLLLLPDELVAREE